ncbi:1-acyl-sn-glycerol-3-phosphate acyltransferase [Pseudohongiella acticola]|nr:1-acyl-sn-glycerol-3-phosphate acyltransferase [Pseudohongiella acticola]
MPDSEHKKITTMRTTIFNTPVLTPLLRAIAAGILRLIGWKAIGKPLQDQRFVLIGAPHTSNWDFPLMLLVVLKLELKLHWMGKHSLFMFPFGGLMRWLGGIPIDRRSHHRVVDQVVARYRENPQLVVLVPPEGTRKKVQEWKTGFYHIANNADVPILMGYLDVSRKEAGLADFFYPTGDVDTDIKHIRAFYTNKKGIRPENAD